MSKLIIKSTYQTGTSGWMFVRKEGDDYIAEENLLTCKDYMHEIIGGHVNNTRTTTVVKKKVADDLSTDKLLMVMGFDDRTHKDISARLFLTMAYINKVEGFEGQSMTTFEKLEFKNGGTPFLIKGSPMYIESPVLLHWLVATLRSMPFSSKLMDAEFDFDTIYKEFDSRDAKVLKFMYKHKIAEALMRHHDDIIKPLGLKKVYPPQAKLLPNTNYHSSFGIWSACSDSLGSRDYKKAINKVFKAENIPFM